jgi:hypothetical protein
MYEVKKIQFTNEYDNLKQHYRFYSIKFDRGLKKQVDWSCLFIFFQIGASFSQLLSLIETFA